MRSLERKFRHGKGIIPITVDSSDKEISIKYCSFPRHQGIITQSRYDALECYNCKYFMTLSSGKRD